jgi:RNA polymerase sigma-70 factor (ECF subfamily)
MMYKAARTVLGNREDARDAVHNVFIRLMDAETPLPELMQNPEAFLYQAARNEAKDIFKSRSRRRLIDDDVSSVEIALPPPDSVDERIERLRSAMARMRPDHAETLKLHYVEGYSCEEIARMRSKFLMTVWKDLSRARIELKKLMKENDSETQEDKRQAVHRPGLAKASEARG